MKMFLFDRSPHAGPLIDPTTRLSDILAALATRMTPEQRGAFLAKMAALDGRERLSAATVTLGRA